MELMELSMELQGGVGWRGTTPIHYSMYRTTSLQHLLQHSWSLLFLVAGFNNSDNQ